MEKAEKSLQITASLMGLDPDELRRALTARVMQAAKGGYKGTVIMVPLKVHEASNARDALAKAIYSKLFDYIVAQINASIPFQVRLFLLYSILCSRFFNVSIFFLQHSFDFLKYSYFTLALTSILVIFQIMDYKVKCSFPFVILGFNVNAHLCLIC